ncbi:YybH family protein [Shivajiella indica]|uniref:YybH family protein n=1 Tax=Shivajiella indica TaxID=872115 RepID=A0ABW5BD36_9BACT
MKNYFRIATACIALSLFSVACSSPAPEEAAAPEVITAPVAEAPDMAAIKAEIQRLETAWAAADNAGDVTALLAFYSDDAVSMAGDTPMAVGKAAIQKEIEASMASRPAGTTTKYETMEVFGDDKIVTEVGKITRMDASGKVTSTGKYMAIWEKRDGKYVCIRDIGNNDAKEN